jgi:hypothetical protein
MNPIRIRTIQSFAMLKTSPKKIPDIVGIIMDDVVTNSVRFIGPFERESILKETGQDHDFIFITRDGIRTI